MSQPCAFTFGDPTPVLSGYDLASLYYSAWNGRYYSPPVDFNGLARVLLSNPHHKSAVDLKVSRVAARFIPSAGMTRHTLRRLAQDLIVFGNAFAVVRRNRIGRVVDLQPLLARWVRVGKGAHWLIADGKETLLPSEVLHLAEPDINQEIYGVPAYLAAIQSALLNEAATLFRRRYYENGSHAGYILYATDPFQNQTDIDALRDALRQSKGPGNFRNLFLYAPGGKKDGLQLIPIAEVAAKDEFLSMKNTSRDDVLAAHRVPPQLLGIIPTNSGGFGSIDQAAAVFNAQEIDPLCATFRDLNDRIGADIVRFADYTPAPVG